MKPRTEQVWAFVQEWYSEHGYPPSLRDIVAGCRLSSTSVAFHHMCKLEGRGVVYSVWATPEHPRPGYEPVRRHWMPANWRELAAGPARVRYYNCAIVETNTYGLQDVGLVH